MPAPHRAANGIGRRGQDRVILGAVFGAVLASIGFASAVWASSEESSSREEAPVRVVARSTAGVVTADELDAWLAKNPTPAGGESTRWRKRQIHKILVDRVLLERFAAAHPAVLPGGRSTPAGSSVDLPVADREYLAWHRLLERRLAAAALDALLASSSEPSPQEVAQELAKDPGQFDRPTRWKLQNLWQARPEDPAAAERVRARMEQLRAELEAGADFAVLARTESESQTRVRGGRMGWARLDRLRPEIRAAVASMKAGDLSAVIEQDDGWTILRCEEVRPGQPVRGAEALERMRRRLVDQRFQALQEAVETAALERLGARWLPSIHPLAPSPENPSAAVDKAAVDPSSPAVRFADGSSLSVRDVYFFLRERGRMPAPGGEIAPEPLEALLLTEARAREARRRGATDTSAFRDRLAAETLQLQVEWVLDPELRAAKASVTDDEVAALFAERRETLVAPEEVHIRRVVLPFYRGTPQDVVDLFLRVAAEAEAGALDFAGVLDRLESLDLNAEDFGWISTASAFHLGRAVTSALAEMEPGELAGPLQEGKALSILELIGRRPPRQLTFDEAAPALRRTLERHRRETRRRELRQAVVTELKIEILEDGP